MNRLFIRLVPLGNQTSRTSFTQTKMMSNQMAASNRDTALISQQIAANKDIPTPGTKWTHRKGGRYKVIGISLSATELEIHILYEDIDPKKSIGCPWSRPLNLFLERFSPDDAQAAIHEEPEFT